MAGKCFACGKEAMQDRAGTFRFEPPPNVPGGPLVIENAEWRECGECGERVIPHALHKALEAEVRRRQGLLTPAEIKAVRERTGLSQEAIGQLLGVGDKTYTRWETGKSIQNKANDNLIRLLELNADRLLQLEMERRPERRKEVADYVANLQQIKGENKVAMAAHGGTLSKSAATTLRRYLQELLGE